MKQPKIKLYDQVHNVHSIQFNSQGEIIAISYYNNDKSLSTSLIFKGDTVPNKNLSTSRKIQKETPHPYHNYSFTPNLEKLLILN